MKRIVALTLIFLIILIPVNIVENKLTEQTFKITLTKEVQDNESYPAKNSQDKFTNLYLPIIIIFLAAIHYYSSNTNHQPLRRKLLARFYQSNYLISTSLK